MLICDMLDTGFRAWYDLRTVGPISILRLAHTPTKGFAPGDMFLALIIPPVASQSTLGCRPLQYRSLGKPKQKCWAVSAYCGDPGRYLGSATIGPMYLLSSSRWRSCCSHPRVFASMTVPFVGAGALRPLPGWFSGVFVAAGPSFRNLLTLSPGGLF